MPGETIALENTGDLNGTVMEGTLALVGASVYLDRTEQVDDFVEGEPSEMTSTISLAEILRLAFGANDALGNAMGLHAPVDATEARISLGQVRITVEFLPAE